MPKDKNIVGRPPKEIEDLLCKSIKVRFNIEDYCNLLTKAEEMKIPLASYARELILKGKITAPFTADEIRLMHQIAGVANNVNQITKHLNIGEYSSKADAIMILRKLRDMLYDRKKY
ncbi:MAG: plasmid mobilization relaxosome protein MobC [Rikenellaceae bacterium]